MSVQPKMVSVVASGNVSFMLTDANKNLYMYYVGSGDGERELVGSAAETPRLQAGDTLQTVLVTTLKIYFKGDCANMRCGLAAMNDQIVDIFTPIPTTFAAADVKSVELTANEIVFYLNNGDVWATGKAAGQLCQADDALAIRKLGAKPERFFSKSLSRTGYYLKNRTLFSCTGGAAGVQSKTNVFDFVINA